MDSWETIVCSNLSRETVSDVFKLPEALQSYQISLVVIYMVYLVVGLPWNLLVMGIVLKERLYQQPTILLLLNLVLTDCLHLVILAVDVVSGIAGEIVWGASDYDRCQLCRCKSLIGSATSLSSILTIAAIAFDRFFFIHKPLHYEKWISVKSTVGGIVVIWILSIFYPMLQFGLFRNIYVNELMMNCNLDFSSYRYFHIASLLLILLPYLFLLVCNVWVVAIVLKNIRKVYSTQKPSPGQARHVSLVALNQRMKEARSKKRFHLMRVFGGIIAANSLTSLPLAILPIFAFPLPVTLPKEYIILSTVLFHLRDVIHPFLESTLISEVKAPMLKLLSCICCCNRKRDAYNISGSDDSKRQGKCATTCCGCCCQGNHMDMWCCGLFQHSNPGSGDANDCTPPKKKGITSLHSNEPEDGPSDENSGHVSHNYTTGDGAVGKNPKIPPLTLTIVKSEQEEEFSDLPTIVSTVHSSSYEFQHQQDSPL